MNETNEWKGINRSISPSITKSIVYPVLAAVCFYLGISGPRKEYTELADKCEQAINSNTNLARVLELEYHVNNSRVADGINEQLKAEISMLLTKPETRNGYSLIEKRRSFSYDGIEALQPGLGGMGSAAFGSLGIFTILNTIGQRKRNKKKGQ